MAPLPYLDKHAFDVLQDQRAEHNVKTGECLSFVEFFRLHVLPVAASSDDAALPAGQHQAPSAPAPVTGTSSGAGGIGASPACPWAGRAHAAGCTCQE